MGKNTHLLYLQHRMVCFQPFCRKQPQAIRSLAAMLYMAICDIIGHNTLDMVKHYLQIAQADIQTEHNHASPVTNWGL